MKHFNKIIIVILISFLTVSSLYADKKTEAFQKKMFTALGSSNQGTNFYLTFHPSHESYGGNANEHRLYITSDIATSVKITIPGKKIEKNITTIPYGIVKVAFSAEEAQCYRKDIPDPPLAHQVFKGFAIIIEADDPVVVYGMTRFSLTSDGFLAIPISGCGNEYVVEAYNDYTSDANGNSYYTPYFSVVGIYDKTEVTCRLGGYYTSSYTMGDDKWVPGEERTKVLNKGDVWLVGVAGDYCDVTGTLVQSKKPVSVIAGNFRTGIPMSFASRDYLISQMLPTSTWGNKYHVTPIFGRKAGSIVRIFALEDNTNIFRDGEQWAKVKKGKGGTEIDGGYVEKVASNKQVGPRPVLISADSKIHVAQYNPTGYFDGSNTDPFMMSLTPLAQYQTEVVFCSPDDFRNNYVNICYKSTTDGFIPDDLEFGYALDGEMLWKKLSLITDSGEPFIDPYVTDGREWKVIQLKLWDSEGVYAIRSKTPFTAYGYGFESADSYGYPLASALRDISKPDIWAPVPSYTMLVCQGIVEGSVYDAPKDNEELRSNLGAVLLYRNESYNYTLEIDDDFISGETYEMNWSLNVEDPYQDAKAVVLFTDRAGNDTTITIEYISTQFNINPILANFGQFVYNDSLKRITMKLVNETKKEITVDSIFLMSSDYNKDWDYNGFKIDDKIYTNNILPKIMAEGEELEFDVTFDPASVKDLIEAGKSNFIDSIGIKANYDEKFDEYCYYQYKAFVKAKTGQPLIQVDKIDFNLVAIDKSKTMTIPIYNNGNADLTISGYSLPSGFEENIYIPDLDGIGPKVSFIIPVGNFKMLSVTFTPNALQSFPDKIIFTSDTDTTNDKYDPICELNGVGYDPSSVIDMNLSDIITLSILPNPIVSSAKIDYSINSNTAVNIKMYVIDILGNNVLDIESGMITQGSRSIEMNTNSLANGEYFLIVKLNNNIYKEKFMISR